MLDLHEISDRFEIRDLLVDYAYKVDEGDYDGLRQVFTEDAELDYRETGAVAGDLETVIAYLKEVMPLMVRSQHMMGNTRFRIEGDRAETTTQCFNPLVINTDAGEHPMFVGLWYVDTLVRTSAGWRIRERRQRLCYTHNFPEGFESPDQQSPDE